MEIGLAILLFVCMTALLYVILSLKITRQVDLQMKEFYKTRIHTDIQEFYREMEGYTALFEGQIQRLKSLIERGDVNLRDGVASAFVSRDAQTDRTPEPPFFHPEHGENISPSPAEKGKREGRRNIGSGKRETMKPAKSANRPVAKGAPEKMMPLPKATVKKAAPPPVARRKAAAAAAAPAHKPMAVATRAASPILETEPEINDTAIAEELMRDLFEKDEVHLSQRRSTPTPTQGQTLPTQPASDRLVGAAAADESSTAGERTMANFFSRLGRAVEPVLFGEKTSGVLHKAPTLSSAPRPEAEPEQVPAVRSVPQIPAAKATANFSEVLKRAEQIKAEKKAERERAEIEARAEFYARGDSFAPQTDQYAQRTESFARPADTHAVADYSAKAPPLERSEPRRNTLAVKELDRHTVNFLIDSLVNDNGFRKQALRALTENNIPLSEIARLSKMDIGELELMRQLGHF